MIKCKYSHEDYVSLEQAKALKELGFDWMTRAWYSDLYNEDNWDFIIAEYFKNFNDPKYDWRISAPTLAQAQKWLRGNGIGIEIQIYTRERSDWGPNYFSGVFYGAVFTSTKDARMMGRLSKDYNTYEEALSSGIDKALELLKEQSNELDKHKEP